MGIVCSAVSRATAALGWYQEVDVVNALNLTLRVSFPRLSAAEIDALFHHISVGNVVSLYIEGLRSQDISALLQALASSRCAVQELKLENCKLTSVAKPQGAATRISAPMRTLSLDGSTCRSSTLSVLFDALQSCSTLTALSFRGCLLSTAGPENDHCDLLQLCLFLHCCRTGYYLRIFVDEFIQFRSS